MTAYQIEKFKSFKQQLAEMIAQSNTMIEESCHEYDGLPRELEGGEIEEKLNDEIEGLKEMKTAIGRAYDIMHAVQASAVSLREDIDAEIGIEG